MTLALALITASHSVRAEDSPIDVTASLGLGIKGLDFEEKRFATIVESQNAASVGATFRNTQKLDEDIYYADLGVAVAFGRVYISFNYELPLHEPSTSKSFFNPADITQQFTTSTDVEREDWAATVGVNIAGGLTAFAGWKFGESKQTGIEASAVGNAPQGFNQTFEEEGPFVGLGYGIPIADAGILSFSVAYADLDAEYSEGGRFGVPFPADSMANTLIGPERYTGDATGFSYALQWQGELTQQLLYNAAIKYQKYDLDGKGVRINTTNPNVTGQPVEPFSRITLDTDTTEEITAFVVGLRYLF
jgi:hypothetical protein